MQKNAQRRAQSDEGCTMDLREKLSRSEQPPRSLDTRPRMAEPRDRPLSSSRTARGSSQMISSSSSHPAWALEDLRRRSPERFVDTSRGRSPPRNAGSFIGIPREPSPPRNGRRMIGSARDRSPPRSDGRIIGSPRDISPPRDAGRRFGPPRDQSPPRNAGRVTGSPRDRSPPRNAGRRMGPPRDQSPPRSTRSFSSNSRALSPARNMGSYMSSSQGFSPPRNPRSYMGSSRGSPPRSNIEDFHGRSRMLDNMRASPYPVRGVLNGQAPSSGAPFARPMLPPPVPNPHPLPPLSQLPPLGSIMQNSPFSVRSLFFFSICGWIFSLLTLSIHWVSTSYLPRVILRPIKPLWSDSQNFMPSSYTYVIIWHVYLLGGTTGGRASISWWLSKFNWTWKILPCL